MMPVTNYAMPQNDELFMTPELEDPWTRRDPDFKRYVESGTLGS
jgi:hypothetical protein